MSRFRVSDRVLVDSKVVPGPELVFGRIEQIHRNPLTDQWLALVRLDNKDMIKCLEDNLSPVEENVAPETITITRDDFLKAVAEVIDPTKYAMDPSSALMLSMSGVVICGRLEKALFGEKAKHD